jgi:hypothetical protein
MKNISWAIMLFFMTFVLAGCNNIKSSSSRESIQVAFHDIPYPTEKYLRIGYTLKTWEYEKESLELQQIQVLDKDTHAELFVIDKNNMPKIYKEPLETNPYFRWDTLTHYYLSIQLPIPLGTAPPKNVFHRFILKDTSNNSELIVEGGAFSPRTNETPLVIASPLKGENLYFLNQSTMQYHFYVLLFMNGNIYRPERYAIDTTELNGALISNTTSEDADLTKNESYINYGRPLYAVADGVVVHVQDGRDDNSGNKKTVTFNSADEYAGNYLVLDIGNGQYAYYCHCIKGKFLVKVGDTVREGDKLALLGNSGNSDWPHLHFHVADGPELWTSNGIPFVLKGYTKTGTFTSPGPGTLLPNENFTDTMMFKVE